MSSIPGYTLEAYVEDEWRLCIEGTQDAEFWADLEARGHETGMTTLTTDEFKTVVAIYEPLREEIERKLHEFDTETSWRYYRTGAFDFTEEVDEVAAEVVRRLREKKAASKGAEPSQVSLSEG